MAKRRNGKAAGPTVYPSYRFTGQDPVLKTVIALRGRLGNELTDAEIKKRSGLSDSTAKNWHSGKTRRPQHSTLAAYVGAMGYRFSITPKK